MYKQSVIGCLLILLSMVMMAGCGRADSKSMIADANDLNVKRLATIYSFFHLKNRFRGPKNEAELKKFIADQDPARMELAGVNVADVDSLFVSERDNLPFKIRYGLNTRVRGPSLPVIFEDTGVDGVRQVGFTNGSMKEVESNEYNRLFRGGGDKEKIDDGRG